MTDAAIGDAPSALADFLELERARVNEALEDALPDPDSAFPVLHRAMRHSLFAGGKRLRPLLAIAAAKACGARAEKALPAACAVEMIHTYSLIHDDLPSFDDEELRRGQPSCHAVYGEAMAILAGDALQALAFEHIARARTETDPEHVATATATLATAAGSTGMCGGQALDIQAAGRSIDLDELRRLHAAKTGALLTASVLCGAILAGADEERLSALRRYGDAVGLAFQIVDDLLDVDGDVETLGKRPGGDADRGQPTFPALIGVEEARKEAARLEQRAVAALETFDERADVLRKLAAYIIDRRR